MKKYLHATIILASIGFVSYLFKYETNEIILMVVVQILIKVYSDEK